MSIQAMTHTPRPLEVALCLLLRLIRSHPLTRLMRKLRRPASIMEHRPRVRFTSLPAARPMLYHHLRHKDNPRCPTMSRIVFRVLPRHSC